MFAKQKYAFLSDSITHCSNECTIGITYSILVTLLLTCSCIEILRARVCVCVSVCDSVPVLFCYMPLIAILFTCTHTHPVILGSVHAVVHDETESSDGACAANE